jgi:hypothetical protein
VIYSSGHGAAIIMAAHLLQEWEVLRVNRKPGQRNHSLEAGKLRYMNGNLSEWDGRLGHKALTRQHIDGAGLPGAQREQVPPNRKMVERRADRSLRPHNTDAAVHHNG